MFYTVTQSKDLQMFEFWNEYTVAGKKSPMLCMAVHEDCLDTWIVNTVKADGEALVFFESDDGR